MSDSTKPMPVLEDVQLGLFCKNGTRTMYGDGITLGDLRLDDLVYIEEMLLPVVEKIRRGLLRRSCERHGIPCTIQD